MRRRSSGEQEGGTQFEDDEGDLYPEQVRQGRGGGDELHGRDIGDVRVWFVGRSDVESRQGSDHDVID